MKQIHLDRWAEMLAYQKEIAPFPVTLAEAAKVWGFGANRTSRSPRNTMQVLVNEGYCKERKPFGRCSFYFAVDPMEED